MKRLISATIAACLVLVSAMASQPADQPTVIVAVGAPGEDDFGTVFIESAQAWKAAADQAQARFIGIGLVDDASTNDLEELRAALERETRPSPHELWIVLLGHGTWDGKEARFNLRGPDLTATNLAALLRPIERPIAVINAASSSAPFMKTLAATNRVVLTSTRSGSEENYARFGKYISQAIAQREADLDKDGQTSLLEAFLIASRRVAEFYKSEGRLATEHALLDDNGDGLGTQADWFRGVRVVKAPVAGGKVDGLRAHQWHLVRSSEETKLTPDQRQRRDRIELEIATLRDQKPTVDEDDYYRRLEALLTELAPLIDPSEIGQPGP